MKRIDFYNNFAYLVYKDSLIILNISNVNSLTLVNSIPLSPFYDIVISNNHLYVFDYYSFKVYDLSNPSNPSLTYTTNFPVE